jgi:heptosyltransferase-3
LAELLKSFLIVRTDRIGDVILTLPMARAIKKHIPDAYVVMLIQRYTAELVEDDKSVDEILFYDEQDRLVPFFQLVALIRDHRFDVVFHTHPRLRLAFITWLANIPVRIGTGYRWYSFLFNRKVFEHRKDAKRHELEYNLNLLAPIDCAVNPAEFVPRFDVNSEALEKIKVMMSAKGIENNQQLVVLHPGTGGSAREWGASNFGKLGKKLAQFPKIRVIVVGGKNEKALVDDVCKAIGKDSVAIINQMSLKEYAALLKLSALFVGNSTGPIHLASAVGTPVIGLYPHIAPLSAARWGPYTEMKTIFSPVDQPENYKKCISKKEKACECMESISVDSVYDAAVKYLSKN